MESSTRITIIYLTIIYYLNWIFIFFDLLHLRHFSFHHRHLHYNYCSSYAPHRKNSLMLKDVKIRNTRLKNDLMHLLTHDSLQMLRQLTHDWLHLLMNDPIPLQILGLTIRWMHDSRLRPDPMLMLYFPDPATRLMLCSPHDQKSRERSLITISDSCHRY